MPRFFNTTGPCNPAQHYMLPAADRLPLARRYLAREQYFVLHAPRQTGKTTTIRALAAEQRAAGRVAIWVSLETSQGIEDLERAEPIWLRAITEAAQLHLPTEFAAPDPEPFIRREVGRRLFGYLRAWSASLQRALVLLFDEADTLSGDALVGFLRQLRDGFGDRGIGAFPVSIALVGLRDLRDYLARAKDDTPVRPGSPFNIKAASLTLPYFSEAEVVALLAQHTEETGQAFLTEAAAEIWWQSQGHPFLVGSLADIATSDLRPDPTLPITRDVVVEARERLLRARTTHLDSLAERLKEPRVARVVEAALMGDAPTSIAYDSDDFQYVLDLGLLRQGPEGVEAANPIYRELLVRYAAIGLQESLPVRPSWPWLRPDGGLDLPALLRAFRLWWRENADVLPLQAPNYPEALPHLALMAFLQRTINGGGRIHREFAAGRGALDLLIEFASERFAMEVKRCRTRDSMQTIESQGVTQLARYLAALHLTEGHLIVFDVRPDRTWEERCFERVREIGGRTVYVWGA